MVKNMGKLDKIIRIAAALVVGVLILAGVLQGALAWVLGIVAVLFLATSAWGTCPVYLPFGVSTKKKSEK